MATPRFFRSFLQAGDTGGTRLIGRSTATTTAVAQTHEPPGELESQQHIVGRLEARHCAGGEQQGAQSVVGDVGLHAVDAVLHGGTAHLAAHKSTGSGSAQLFQGHTLPVVRGIRNGYGQRGVFLVVIHLTHCHQV